MDVATNRNVFELYEHDSFDTVRTCPRPGGTRLPSQLGIVLSHRSWRPRPHPLSVPHMIRPPCPPLPLQHPCQRYASLSSR